jgi:hypothetical protein
MKCLLAFVLALGVLAGPASAQDWNIQVVDDGGTTGWSSRVVATSDGIPYILYQDGSNNVTLAWYVTGGGPGGWDRLTLSDRDGYHQIMGMEVDGYDKIHIAYSNMIIPYGIKYGVYDHASKAWELSPEVASTSYGDLSLALWDSSGTTIPFIAVSLRADPEDVRVMKRDPGSGSWLEEIVWDDYATDRPSIAIGAAGTAHVSFYDVTGSNLMYSTNAGGLWVTEYVDIVGAVGYYNAIVIDAGNTPYIVYYDSSSDDLKYAKLLN